MRSRLLPIAALLAVAAVGRAAEPAPAPRAVGPTESVVYRLRNVAAQDAAVALNSILNRQGQSAAVVADPVSNTVLVSGRAAQLEQVTRLLTALDAAPRSVVVQALVVQVPLGFAAETGLATGIERSWVLSGREVRMFTVQLREAKKAGRIEFLTRPTLQILDNQTGVVQVGVDARVVTIRTTPRVLPGGKVLLRAVSQVNSPAPAGGTHAESVQTTRLLADGGTMAFTFPGAGGEHETLYLFTVHVVKGDSK
jgi:type II secretory pathway component GspD/PulD (secretin)